MTTARRKPRRTATAMMQIRTTEALATKLTDVLANLRRLGQLRAGPTWGDLASLPRCLVILPCHTTRHDTASQATGGLAVQHRDPRGIPSREEERELIRRAQQSPTEAERIEAQNELVTRHYGFIIKIARRFTRDDFEDCCQVAAVALIERIAEFDLSRDDARLTTYASFWMRQALQYHASARPMIPPPRWVAQKRVVKPVAHPKYQAMRDRTMAAVAKLSRGVVRFRNADRSHRGEGPGIHPVDQRPMPHEVVGTADEIDRIKALVVTLAPIEREAICHRYGLDGRERLTLVQASAKLGITGEGVRKAQDRAIAKIRLAMTSRVDAPEKILLASRYGDPSKAASAS